MKNTNCSCKLFAGLVLSSSLYWCLYHPKKKGQMKRHFSVANEVFGAPCFDDIHFRIGEYGRLGRKIYIGEHWETDVEVLVSYHLMSSFKVSLL